MAEQLKPYFKEVVGNIFNRWTALKLAVEHGMGGPNGLQVRNFVLADFTCCKQNILDCNRARGLCDRLLRYKRESRRGGPDRPAGRHHGPGIPNGVRRQLNQRNFVSPHQIPETPARRQPGTDQS